MSYAAAAQDETEDRYYTQVDAGDVRLFTLDQLDAAFNVGLIHENTYVCLEGDSSWVTLGDVAGLGDEEPISAPQLIQAPVSHYSQYGAAASPSVLPVAPYSVAPMIMPASIRPVVNDLSFDDDFEMMAMRPKRRAGKIVAGLAVLALAGLGFAVVQSGGLRGLRLPKLNLGSVGQATAASLSLSSLKDAQVTPSRPRSRNRSRRKPRPPLPTRTAPTRPTRTAPPRRATIASATR
jgi:hypothetical protein